MVLVASGINGKNLLHDDTSKERLHILGVETRKKEKYAWY